MSIRVTEEMRNAGWRELFGDEEEFEVVKIPSQVKPGREEISVGLETMLNPEE